MITSLHSIYRYLRSTGVAIFVFLVAFAPLAEGQQSCLTTRGLVMTANVGPVAVSGRLATILQHGNWDTRPNARFAVLDRETAVETGNWKAVWNVEDIELKASTAFVAADDRLIAIDLRDPADPVELDYVDLVNAEHLTISASRAYVLSTAMDGNPRLDIVEVSDPSGMERRGSYSWGPGDLEPHAISADRGVVVVGNDEGMVVIDARDPWNPIRGGRWSGSSTDAIALVDRLAVIATSDPTDTQFGVRLVDVTRPGHIEERGYWESPSRVVSVVRFGSNAAVATSGHGIFVIDLEAPDAPAAIDHWDGFGLGAIEIAAAWPNIAVANDRIGLIVLNLKPECLPPRQTSGRTKP